MGCGWGWGKKRRHQTGSEPKGKAAKPHTIECGRARTWSLHIRARPGFTSRVKPRHLPLLPLLLMPVLTSLTAADSRSASARPPGGLTPAQAPQFVLLGFDDNPDTGPMTWFVDYLQAKRNPAGSGKTGTFDGGQVRAIFYSNGKYWSDQSLVAIHRRALAEGHEIGNHTQNHENGGRFAEEKWRAEMAACMQTFADAGIPAEDMRGFRTPFLAYNAATFAAVAAEGFAYDSSIEEGEHAAQDGTNFLWPYTLGQGSPGNATTFAPDSPKRVGSHPGLWEIPLHVFMIPSDADCARHGVAPGLRARIGANLKQAYGAGSGEPAEKISGLDWNVLEAAKCDGPEFLAILKHTLDLRLAGNRAPLMVGGHTALYPADKPDRRKAMEEFIAYALSKPGVRFVTGRQLLEWMRQPQALR